MPVTIEDDVAWHGLAGDAGHSCNYGGLEIEVALVPPPAFTKAHRKNRQVPDKGLARVTAFHRDPEAEMP
ncbi:MAG: hypothetical protein M3394_09470 [Actinomycetota bacterium]|nr:hypothetical protein [Actinomycetota bacterium]